MIFDKSFDHCKTDEDKIMSYESFLISSKILVYQNQSIYFDIFYLLDEVHTLKLKNQLLYNILYIP